MSHPYFSKDFFVFWNDLRRNNNREWFAANKRRYETTVKEPALRFITDIAAPLRRISPYLVADARPNGGSMFRVHRDTRFSRDKTPYKTHTGIHFAHGHCGRDAHAPGFYLHLDPDEVFAAGGLWHPDNPTLNRIRNYLVEEPAKWRAVLRTGLQLGGDSLKRPPAGFDASHPLIVDLKRKDFITSLQFTHQQVCSADFLERYLEACRQIAPLLGYLCQAVEVPWK